MRILSVAVPEGIGDSLWSLTKVPGLLAMEQKHKAEIIVCCGSSSELGTRAVEFVKRFDFVSDVKIDTTHRIPCDPVLDGAGHYNYTPNGKGFHGIYDWMIQCNHELERGVRLENIVPEAGTCWDIASHFRYDDADWQAVNQLTEEAGGDYVVFYAGPEEGNTQRGHNRGAMWSAYEWVKLERAFRDRGLRVVITGAMYDRSYVENYLRPAGFRGFERVGVWPIHTTFAVIKKAKAVISYQCGLGIMAVFMGVPTAMWWAPKGHSQSPEHFISFEESMAHCWAPRGAVELGKYLPLIYTRCDSNTILEHADKHWLGK